MKSTKENNLNESTREAISQALRLGESFNLLNENFSPLNSSFPSAQSNSSHTPSLSSIPSLTNSTSTSTSSIVSYPISIDENNLTKKNFSIEIRGAYGVNALSINGIYMKISPTLFKKKEEISNKLLEYSIHNQKWYIKSINDKGKPKGWLRFSFQDYLTRQLELSSSSTSASDSTVSGTSEEGSSSSPPPITCISLLLSNEHVAEVWDGTTWRPQPYLNVLELEERRERDVENYMKLIKKSPSIEITGATGSAALCINGIYDPIHDENYIEKLREIILFSKRLKLGSAAVPVSTEEKDKEKDKEKEKEKEKEKKEKDREVIRDPIYNSSSFSGFPIYKSRDNSERFLEFSTLTSQWFIKPRADLGRPEGWMKFYGNQAEILSVYEKNEKKAAAVTAAEATSAPLPPSSSVQPTSDSTPASSTSSSSASDSLINSYYIINNLNNFTSSVNLFFEVWLEDKWIEQNQIKINFLVKRIKKNRKNKKSFSNFLINFKEHDEENDDDFEDDDEFDDDEDEDDDDDDEDDDDDDFNDEEEALKLSQEELDQFSFDDMNEFDLFCQEEMKEQHLYFKNLMSKYKTPAEQNFKGEEFEKATDELDSEISKIQENITKLKLTLNLD